MEAVLSRALLHTPGPIRGARITYYSLSNALKIEVLRGLIAEGWETVAEHIESTKQDLESLIADLGLKEEFVASNRFIRIDPYFVIRTNGTNLLTAHLLEKAFAKEGVLFRTEPTQGVSGLETDTKFYPFLPSLDDWKWKMRFARRKA